MVALVVIAFFVLRPRAVRQLRASAELLAKETHGRKPLVLASAKCESISLPDKQAVCGVGMLALTEHGLVFAAANPDRTLIIPRVDIINVNGQGSSADSGSTSGVPGVPQLRIMWRSAAGSEATVAFATVDPSAFSAPLGELTP
jgi:hypothetical protein